MIFQNEKANLIPIQKEFFMSVSYKVGEMGERPWGTWEVLAVGSNYIVKRIIVNPHQKLSLQSHEFRSEHWIIASGTGTVTLDDETFDTPQDTHIYIEKQQKHRMENKTDFPVVFIEVQTGDTLDENDIQRYEDIYGRV